MTLSHTVFFKYCRAKKRECFHYFLMERGEFATEKLFCLSIWFSTQFNRWFSIFLKLDKFLFVICGNFTIRNRIEINHLDTTLFESFWIYLIFQHLPVNFTNSFSAVLLMTSMLLQVCCFEKDLIILKRNFDGILFQMSLSIQ